MTSISRPVSLRSRLARLLHRPARQACCDTDRDLLLAERAFLAERMAADPEFFAGDIAPLCMTYLYPGRD